MTEITESLIRDALIHPGIIHTRIGATHHITIAGRRTRPPLEKRVHRPDRPRIQPFVQFSMAIGKGKRRPAVVQAARHILPRIRSRKLARYKLEDRVIDAVRMLANNHPNPRWPRT